MSTRIHCLPAGQQKGGGAHWPQPEAAYLDPLCTPSDTVLIKRYPDVSIATWNALLAAAIRQRDAVGSCNTILHGQRPYFFLYLPTRQPQHR